MSEEQMPYYPPGEAIEAYNFAVGAGGAGGEVVGKQIEKPDIVVPPRILIAGTSWVDNEHTRELVKLSTRTIATLNPGESFILIDSCSPFDPRQFLAPNLSEQVFRFDENIGAINRGGKDGAGRSLSKAIEYAIAGNYDYVAIHETDFVFAKPVRPIIERMHKAGVKVASPGLASPYAFCEWGIFFLNVAYARETNFIARYDWEHSQTWPLVEIKLEQLFGDDLFLLGLRGQRNDGNVLNVANLANAFPYTNCTWLTHCADLNLYTRMLELNGVLPK